MNRRVLVTLLALLPTLVVPACGGGGGGGGGGTDPGPFAVQNADPRDGSGNLPNDTALTVFLNLPVNRVTVSPESVVVRRRDTGATQTGFLEVSSDNLSVTFRPSPWFDTSTTYDLEVNQRLASQSGEALSSTFLATYTTSPWPSPQRVHQAQFREVIERMDSSRSQHTSTLLSSGNVLLVGGYVSGSSVTNSAEIFGPTREEFFRTPGSMATSRANHTATLLGSGLVLIAGGERPSDRKGTRTAELFSNASLRFFPTDDMASERTAHTATLLGDGTVLVTGGKTVTTTGTFVHSSAEIFDPSSETWFPASNSMAFARWAHRAIRLPDGRVLITGGADTRVAEVFDPVTRRFSSLSSQMLEVRSQHVVEAVENGLIFISDGGATQGEYFNPDTDSFFATSNKGSVERLAAVSMVFRPGEVLILGGYQFNADFSGIFLHSTMEQFVQSYGSGGSYFHVPGLPDSGVYLPDSRAFSAVSKLNDGRFLITGGLGPAFDGPDLNTAVLFDPSQ